jgi:hypothetical protein
LETLIHSEFLRVADKTAASLIENLYHQDEGIDPTSLDSSHQERVSDYL